MIPKIVHYCWFGGKEKPEKVMRCIASWQKHLPDYRIIEWSEANFDYKALPYAQAAYEAGKYAFVSDVARLQVLLHHGGIYMDTDVEVVKSFDDLLCGHCILGMEERNYIATSFMAAVPGHPLIKEFFDQYRNAGFSADALETNVTKLTALLEAKGFVRKNIFQQIGNISIYPREYFSPYDYINCIDLRTEKTYCIHYFYVTWQSWSIRLKKSLKKIISRLIGKKRMDALRGYYE